MAADPDIVALQEVDAHWSNRSEFDNQPELLAEWLDMELAFYRYYNRPPTEESDGKRRQFGDVILSKYPILETNGYPLPQENKDKPYFDRLLAEAKINIRDTPIWFYDAHLYAFEADRRSIQIEKVLEITQDREGP
ncbi:endonuclease/exonuclease/phosphatase family protein [Haladaptatus halobius]|uniref:endonuclease/exonuclease/phosphatase family protein n=1 Tax=Haladaptatus halobius TaxID=2884875 RepID=UPI001D0BDD62|nr:endonuclease/exonuclease/phosphatase family protein [Haladaptatus halobius]